MMTPHACKHCGIQNDHREECQDHAWHLFIEKDKIKFLTARGLMHLYKAPTKTKDITKEEKNTQDIEDTLNCDICNIK